MTNLEELQIANTTIIQSLRAQENGDPIIRDFVNHIQSVCDALEDNIEVGRRNAELTMELAKTFQVSVAMANDLIQRRNALNAAKSANDLPGEEA